MAHTGVKLSQTRRRLAAGEARRGGGLRVSCSGNQNDGGDVLRVAGELPHPVVQVAGHGDAVNDAGELDSGGRSSAVHGKAAAASKHAN